MAFLISLLATGGLIIWAIRTKKYCQALFVFVALIGIVSFLAGTWYFSNNDAFPGALLMAIGVMALLGTAVAVKL